MNFDSMLPILMGILAFVSICISYYMNIKSKLTNAAIDAINTAEDTDLENSEKFKQAVDEIVNLIPVVARPFIPRNIIELLVQKTFDKIKEFAVKRAQK